MVKEGEDLTPQSLLNLQPQQKVMTLDTGDTTHRHQEQMGSGGDKGTLQTPGQLPTLAPHASVSPPTNTLPSLPSWPLLVTFLLLLCELNSPPPGPSRVESQGRGRGTVAGAGTDFGRFLAGWEMG